MDKYNAILFVDKMPVVLAVDFRKEIEVEKMSSNEDSLPPRAPLIFYYSNTVLSSKDNKCWLG